MTDTPNLTEEQRIRVAAFGLDRPELDLDAIEERAASATEAPWQTYDAYNSLGVEDVESERMLFIENRGVTTAYHAPDAVFIAHAREDVPLLIAEVRRLRATIDRLRTGGSIPPRSTAGGVYIHGPQGEALR